MIHIEGRIKDESDQWGTQTEIMCKDGHQRDLARLIEHEIYEATGGDIPDVSHARYPDEESLIGVEASSNIPNVGLSIYYSETECSLEEAQTNVILNAIGCLDIYQIATGYSEYAVMGYDTENFELVSDDGGSHDLNIIFGSLDGKYVHILIDI